MAYIGKQPAKGNFVKLDTITVTATTTFNLTNGGVAYYPQSANNCLVSLNGILQAPTDSYTISGSTIIFSSALTTSDVIDFIIVLGDVLSLGTVSDSTIGIAKFTATGTPSSSTFLRGDNSWASAGATAGQVIQVVTNTYSTTQETSSTSFTASGLSASITPASSSNKILAIASFTGGNNNGISSTGLDFCYTLYRGSTNLGDASNGFTSVNYYTSSGNAPILYSIPVTINYLDSPSTISSTTYTVYYKTNNSSSSAQFLRTGAKAVITLLEIKG